MKLLFSSITFLLSISVFLITSGVSDKLEPDNYIQTEKLVSNVSNKAIPLYAENSETDQILTHLKPGLSLPFAYSGSTGDWNYVFLNDSVVSIRSKEVGFSYRFFDLVSLPVGLVNGSYWASLSVGIMSFVFMFGLLILKISADDWHETEDVDDEYALDLNLHKPVIEKNNIDNGKINNGNIRQQAVEKKAELPKNEVRPSDKSTSDIKEDSEAKLKEARLKKARVVEKLKQDKERKRRELIAAKKEKLPINENELTDNSKREKSRLRHELITIANDESDARYRGQATIAEMKGSYERLLDRYQQIKTEASGLGFKFDDAKFETLLKARGYQICVVSSLIKDKKFTILEWVPGRSFESDVNAATSINPNLVLQDVKGKVVGIECKYRSSYYSLNKEKEISWASVKQAEQYQRFSKTRNMPVFIAIGVKGKSKIPKYNFLVPLSQIYEKSIKDNLDGMGFQLIVKYKQIGDSYIKSGDYSSYLESIIS